MGFVKAVIDATGLPAMGTLITSGALLKGFKEGAKAIKDALSDFDDKADTMNEKEGSSAASDTSEAEATEASSKEET